MKSIVSALILLFIFQFSFASGIKGHIKDEKGNPLAFATIYNAQTGSGTVTNKDGYYEIRLTPGRYSLIFQFLGYETQAHEVAVRSEFLTKNISMQPQSIELKTVEITDGMEDPAYAIMRKAIAKSSYHRQQIDEYSARVYIKGAARILDVPRLFRKKLKKEGIDSTMAFVSESVSEIIYQRPNTFKEKVISIRQQGDDNNTSPNDFIFTSFYEKEIAETVSPLSPAAFSYYRFKFEGSYFDRGYEVNKIRVIPRSRGENVFEGTIFIVEDAWSIYSLSLVTYKLGFAFDIKQIYAPIQEKAWLPVTHKFEVKGGIWGFDFVYNYLATISDYKIQLNENLAPFFDELEEGTETIPKKDEKESTKEKFYSDEELTRKDLRKIIKEYEKAEKESEPEPEIELVTEHKIDSLAYKRDSTYWSEIRPIPLTMYEVKSYKRVDSLAIVEKEEESKDEKKTSKSGKFNFPDLLFGDTYRMNDKTSFSINSPLMTLQFNTVEGYAFQFPMHYTFDLANESTLKLGEKPRYAIGRKKLSGIGYIDWNYDKKLRKGSLRLEGGRSVSQLNPVNPISPFVNSFYTLLLEENYMKMYEKDYVLLKWVKSISDNVLLKMSGEYSTRYHLENTDTKPWFDNDNRSYSSNTPENIELMDTEFSTNNAFVMNLGIEWKPWQKYRIHNEKKTKIDRRTPTVFADYTKGFKDFVNSDVDYDLLELGVKSRFNTGARGVLHTQVKTGIFLNNEKVHFPDFHHFLGNQTLFVTSDPVESFRLLDYYQFSTKDKYLQLNVHQQFRKFLFTQIMEVWFMGLKENLFVNYLTTPALGNYFETGYALDNIFKVFRIELVTSFHDFKYESFGIKIGISSLIGASVSGSSEGGANIQVTF
ncbi:MAG: carboxypeptidase-like regulatory domain-containing protein [Bacteroidetes bacterium]|nr:carboxypeptidase-like regulatory domain-containing protein [Bacteroidota bacterium]